MYWRLNAKSVDSVTGNQKLENEIGLDSRSRRRVQNAQRLEAITELERGVWFEFFERKIIGPAYRAEFDPMFNCHGLTFASRRTHINDPSVVEQVLADDGYRLLEEWSGVQPGDIIVYRDIANGEITHTGIVIENVQSTLSSRICSPKIWSKWGQGKEVLHRFDQCPYMKDASVSFYRLDPLSPEPPKWPSTPKIEIYS